MAPQKCYICSFCARSFSRSEHKLRHERSHTKEKPFNCNICHNAFVRRDLLQRHCRTVHGLVLKANIEAAVSSTLDKDNQSTTANKKKINTTIASNPTKATSPATPQVKKLPSDNSQQTVSKSIGSKSLQSDDSTTTENNDDDDKNKPHTDSNNINNNNNNSQSSNRLL
ncbi:unnamed protein product [[Candida] boidinii]|nr:unnamed protein product [[Candida] boidinii]